MRAHRALYQFIVTLPLTLTAAVAAHAAETIRYALMTSDGHRAGEQVVERSDDGLTKVRFIFKDNGRGPEFEERIQRGPDGRVVSYDVVGKSTIGAPVDEHFRQEGDRATWSSTSERGESSSDGTALYVPLMSSFEWNSISLDLVARHKGSGFPLLPSGTLKQTVVDELDVVRDGKSLRIQLVSQVGLGFTPALYWVTADSGTLQLFAVIQTGYMTGIEEGWESHVDTLKARQQMAEGVLLKALRDKTHHPLHGLTVVRNARVFDSETLRVGPASDIYILRGRITGIRAAGTPSTGVDQEIDAGGRIALPGLFDMHSHVSRWDGGLHIAAGVTTVRDMGNDNAQMQQILDELAGGDLLMPQIVPCGFLEGASPNASRNGIVIETLQQAKDAVDWYAVRGYPQLKIYNSFPKAMVRQIVAYAHARGMRVSGHVPVFMRAEDVVEQGYDELQHINQVMLNFLVTPTTDTRTPERIYLPAEKVASLDFDSKRVRDFISLLKRHKTTVDPTLATFDFMKRRDGERSEPYEPIRTHLPPDVQRYLNVGIMKIPDDATAARYRTSYRKMVDFVGRLYQAGVPIVAGTDSIAGFTLHGELELYVKAGLTPAQALQIATRNGARFSRTSGERGRIVTGMLADLILFDGDPTRRIADVRKVALVVTQSSVIYPTEVYRELGIVPFVEGAPSIRTAAASQR